MFRRSKPDPAAERQVRTDRLADGGWELPVGWRRGERPRQTAVGPAGGPAARVDAAGAVTLAGATWSLDWWVGADDRWRVPAAEPALRQALVPGAPAVESAVRIPAGDAVHRCWAVPGALVIEVQNDSPSPFALALALRPVLADGAGRIDTVAVDDDRVLIDGEVALVVGTRPGRVAVSDGATGDVARIVLGGRAGDGPRALRCPDGLASVAVLVPVAHRATVRCTLPIGTAAAPPAVASLDAVVRGWAAQDRTGMSVDLPDAELVSALGATRRSLLVLDADEPGGAADAALVVAALGAWGRHAEAEDIVRTLWARERSDGTFDEPDGRGAPGGPHLLALADVWRRRPDRDLVLSLEDGLTRATEVLVERSRRGRLDPAASHWARVGATAAAAMAGEAGLPRLASMLATLAVDGSLSGAARSSGPDLVAVPAPGSAARGDGNDDVLSVAAHLRSGAAAGQATAIATLRALLDSGRPTWSWPGGDAVLAAGPAGFLLAAREVLLSEAAPGHAAVLPVVDPAWLGQGIELHRAPLLGGGTLSCAVRWHGERPALLWDVEGAAGQVRITTPSLDPSFATVQAKGEALLAAPPAGR